MTTATPAPSTTPPPNVSTVPPSRRDYGWVNGKPAGKGR